jgi:hypothetical protein
MGSWRGGEEEREKGGEKGRGGERRRRNKERQVEVVPGVGLPKAEGKAGNREYVVLHR